MGKPYFAFKRGVCQMAKYIATILIDVEEGSESVHKRSSKGSVKGLLENRIKVGSIDELVFRNGKVVMEIREVKIIVMEIE
jgi:hypothetical protein